MDALSSNYLFDDFGRDPSDDRVRRNILGHDRARSYDRVVSDCHSAKYRGMGSDPHVLPQLYRRDLVVVSVLRLETVIDGRKDHLMTYEASVTYEDPALVLEAAARIDEDPSPNREVLPEISIDWREQAEIVRDIFSYELGHEAPKLIGLMEPRVDLRRDPLRLPCILPQHALPALARGHPSGIEVSQKPLQFRITVVSAHAIYLLARAFG